MQKRLRIFPEAFLICFFVSGCELSLSTAKRLWSDLMGSQQVADSSSAGTVQSSADFESKAAVRAKENSELFREIYSVVMVQEPTSRSEFGSWVDTLNQGASLEGVYNGLILSREYQKLEMTSGAATTGAFQAFQEELNFLVKGAGYQPSVSVSEVDAKSSNYALKRVLASEYLKWIASIQGDREKLAQWYSSWVAHAAVRQVDFGVSLRNHSDPSFHLKWAMGNTEDRLKWEVLNRIHRILNEMEKRKP